MSQIKCLDIVFPGIYIASFFLAYMEYVPRATTLLFSLALFKVILSLFLSSSIRALALSYIGTLNIQLYRELSAGLAL